MSTRFARDARRFISPRARRALNFHGLDVSQISGSGPNGRVVEADVLRSLENPKAPVRPSLESSRTTFSLSAEINASALLKVEARSKISTSEWIERALSRAGSTPSADGASPRCVFQQCSSRRAEEFRPALPHEAEGILGAGCIKNRAFVVDGEMRVCPTLHLTFCGDENKREMLEAIFDLTIEILEDPTLFIFL